MKFISIGLIIGGVAGIAAAAPSGHICICSAPLPRRPAQATSSQSPPDLCPSPLTCLTCCKEKYGAAIGIEHIRKLEADHIAAAPSRMELDQLPVFCDCTIDGINHTYRRAVTIVCGNDPTRECTTCCRAKYGPKAEGALHTVMQWLGSGN
jgi:hypothetical protein